MRQARGALRGPTTVAQGGTIKVEVGTNAPTVEISVAGDGATKSYPVGPDKTVQIPVPNVPGGALLYVSVGQGLQTQVIVVEVVASFRQ